MSNTIGRFLTFEETLGKGLVKFAYYVLLAALAVMTLISMIAALGEMFTESFWEGLGLFLLAPLQFLIAVIVLRVLAELVIAVLSIDDSLAEGGRRDAGMPSLRGGTKGGVHRGGDLTETSIPHGDTEASRPQNQAAPFAGTDAARSEDDLTAKKIPHGDTEASAAANQRAPFADDDAAPRDGQATKMSVPHGDTEASAPENQSAPLAKTAPGTTEPAENDSKAKEDEASSASETKTADLKSSAEPSTNERPARKATKKTAKRTTKKATKKTAPATKKTVEAAKDSPASARSGGSETEDGASGGDEDARKDDTGKDGATS